MTTMQELARVECQGSARGWQVGGSDLYPADVPKRPRPSPEPVFEVIEDEPEIEAFDEALEHCCWCRERGMLPQDVCESIGSKHLAGSWGGAVAILERYIVKMRARK